MREWSLVGLMLVVLFSLGLGGVYFWKQLQKVDNTAITQTPVVHKPGGLQEKMMATKGHLTSVATHMGGMDDKYGGFFYQGVYQELVERKEALKTKEGKVLGQVAIALKSVYLKPDGTLGTVSVARAFMPTCFRQIFCAEIIGQHQGFFISNLCYTPQNSA